MTALTRLICLLVLLAWPAALAAAVEIHFYTKDHDRSFPHAFVAVKGTVDSTGRTVDTNYGFTAKRVSPAILFGPVSGEIVTVDAAYVARSRRHFSLRLSDEEYGAVEALVAKWRALPQPSYRLASSNCVYFVAEVAGALGLDAAPVPKLMKKPRSFLEKVTSDNHTLIASWESRNTVAAGRLVKRP